MRVQNHASKNDSRQIKTEIKRERKRDNERVHTCSCVVMFPNRAANFSISGNLAGSIKFNNAHNSPLRGSEKVVCVCGFVRSSVCDSVESAEQCNRSEC